METKKIWFVTGASEGLGLALTKSLLAAGYPVAATSRNLQTLKDEVGSEYDSFFLPLAVDLTDDTSVNQAIDKSIGRFGRIYVLVNNAGYGIGGAVEELSPPVQFFMGSDALQRATAKSDGISANLEQFRELSVSTDF